MMVVVVVVVVMMMMMMKKKKTEAFIAWMQLLVPKHNPLVLLL